MEPDLGLGPRDLEPEQQYLGLKSQHQSLGPQDLELEPQELEYAPQDLEPEPQDWESESPNLELSSEFYAWDLQIWDWILVSTPRSPLFETRTLKFRPRSPRSEPGIAKGLNLSLGLKSLLLSRMLKFGVNLDSAPQYLNPEP